MAIPLTPESARPPAAALIDGDQTALIDGDQISIVELRERDPKLVALVREAKDSEVAAGGGRKGKRAEYHCAACGYGIVVYGQPPSCPMCSEARWEHVEWRPFSQLARRLDLTQVQEPTRTPLPNHSWAMPTGRSASCRTGRASDRPESIREGEETISLTQAQLREGLRRVDDPISHMLGISGVVGFLVFVVMMTVG